MELPIVTRLREYQPTRYINGECWPTFGSPCGEAADRITELVAENERLKAFAHDVLQHGPYSWQNLARAALAKAGATQ